MPEGFFVVFVNDYFYVWCILCVGRECVVLNEKYGHPCSSNLIVVEYIVTLLSRCVHLLNL